MYTNCVQRMSSYVVVVLTLALFSFKVPALMHPMFTLILALGLAQPAPPPPLLAPEPTPIKTINATVFAYASTVGQTDSSPFTTASGATVADGIVANNCLPFGTTVTFPEQFGNKKFVVQDRMAPRYGCNSFDVWFPSTASARQFGKHYTAVNVY